MSLFTTTLRTLISQDRIRHEELSLNIDLTYITNRILAMSFPATGIEAAWRNDIADVCTLLRSKHKDNFLIWNLSEREYEYEMFDDQVVCVPFKDHHAPPLHMIFQMIHHIDAWLRANTQHVAIVHCMGGKGRTGLVIVCYLFYSGLFTDIDKCLSYFAMRRSAKGKGVTQPSQLRYIRYFSSVVSGEKTVSFSARTLRAVIIGPVPKGVYVFLEIYQQSFAELGNQTPSEQILYTTFSSSKKARSVDGAGMLRYECNVELHGDILVRGFSVEGKSKPKPLFRMQFYVGLVDSSDVMVSKDQLDDMHKEKKKFSPDFGLRMIFHPKVQNVTESLMPYNYVFTHMRDLYRDMLAGRAKIITDAEIENMPGRDVTWHHGNYGGGQAAAQTPQPATPQPAAQPLQSTSQPTRSPPTGLSKTSSGGSQFHHTQPKRSDGAMRQRFSMMLTKSPVTSVVNIPTPRSGTVTPRGNNYTDNTATRQKYLNRQLDYLETQLTEIEALLANVQLPTDTNTNPNISSTSPPSNPSNLLNPPQTNAHRNLSPAHNTANPSNLT